MIVKYGSFVSSLMHVLKEQAMASIRTSAKHCESRRLEAHLRKRLCRMTNKEREMMPFVCNVAAGCKVSHIRPISNSKIGQPYDENS